MGILSRQETPNSVGGGRIMYDNVDDDDDDGDDDDGGHDNDHDHDHDDENDDEDEDEDEDQDDDVEDDEVHGDGKWIGFCQFTVTMATSKSFCV